jgi:hypothetical protein
MTAVQEFTAVFWTEHRQVRDLTRAATARERRA